MTVRIGDRIMLLGDSGSGKSTTLDLLALVLKPDEGGQFAWRPDRANLNLMYLWRAKRGEALGRLRLADLGYVLQTGGLLPFLNVRDNILLPAALKKMKAKDRERRLEELFSVLKIGHLAKKYPHQISVGERQRCAIARAVVHEPALILADEPTASLDPPTSDLVFDLLLALTKNAALIVATHDQARAQRHGFSVYRINFPPTQGAIRAVLTLQ
jgi:ABC-type antimicrobial peptide transport system, ATPase component